MENVIKAGDYTFRVSINVDELNPFCLGLQLAYYSFQIYKGQKYVEPHNSDIYKDLGITRDEFLELIVQSTRQVIESLLYKEIEKNPSALIRSFIFFAGDESDAPHLNKYGFSEHDIFKEISDAFHFVHSYGYDGEKVYVHTCQLVSKYSFDQDGNVIEFDFFADYEIIEEIRDKIEANRFIDLDEI